MKNYLILTILILASLIGSAQVTGPGIMFEYNADGTRKERRYDVNATLMKPGRNNAQPADTVVGYYKNGNQQLPVTDDNIFVKAYPNPVKDVLYFENMSWNETNTAELRFIDISGKTILTKRTNLAKDNIQFGNSLVPGNYQVHYYLNDKFLVSWKVVKL